YWVQFGGGNPIEWCKKLENRLPLLHLKEYGIVENKPTMLELGSGNLDWKRIVKAAKKSGTEWFIIEQDICRIDPFDSLKMSLEYLIKEI
ncbi:MAG: sugar phosphate isomerase/epimerase, partial [bacterium]